MDVSHIGRYPIERELGRGGMGVVYLGRDPRLERPVAIKVLPDAFASDPERLARFEREARILASLHHANIAGIYGLEEADGRRFLALEYVDGDTLAERVAHRPLPIAEALEVCRQVAAALEAAHERGVIHRDLKPSNVKLTPSGEVKVLDFGLAKGSDAGSDSSSDQSPTLTYATLAGGVLLGTAAYMSPEQARGKPVDRRTDIWSFGCLLYECLTRVQLFAGETVSDTIAKILERDPDWSLLPPQTPAKVRELLRRCLEKDAKKRLRDMGDARIELEEALGVLTSSVGGAFPVERRVRRAPWARAGVAWGAAAILGVTAGILAISGALRPSAKVSAARFVVPLPRGVTGGPFSGQAAISPDGNTVALVAADSSSGVRIWIRPLSSLDWHPLAGTESAANPFWSPDGRWLGFFAESKLKKIPIAGGHAEILCDANNGRGGAWNPKGDIVFAPAGEGPLFRVSSDGGDPVQATFLDTTLHETAHRFPQFLPDGQHFLYSSLPARQGKCDIYLTSLGSKQRRKILSAGGTPAYSPPGYLLYVRNDVLVAQRFDPRGLRSRGEPLSLGDQPLGTIFTGGPLLSSSSSGSLVYLGGLVGNTIAVWLGRSGERIGKIDLPPGQYFAMNVSRDGRSAAFVRATTPSTSDIWLADLTRGTGSRFTFGPGSTSDPVWSPDGSRLLFESNSRGPSDFHVRPVNGSGPDVPVLENDIVFKHPVDWSSDGKSVVFDQLDAKTGWDIWILPMDGSGKPVSYLRTPFNERAGSISPDNHWLAYSSDETGRFELYVQSFPVAGQKYQISNAGGFGGVWRKDGKQMIFAGGDGTVGMQVDVTAGTEFHSGTPRPGFAFNRDMVGFAPAPNFDRFLVTLNTGEQSLSSPTVVLNWTAALPKR